MNIITILHKLLDRAYRKAADRATARAVKAGNHMAALESLSAELARKIQAAQEEHHNTFEYREKERETAARIEEQRKRAADLFGGV